MGTQVTERAVNQITPISIHNLVDIQDLTMTGILMFAGLTKNSLRKEK